MVHDPLKKSHGAFDKAVKDAAGDLPGAGTKGSPFFGPLGGS